MGYGLMQGVYRNDARECSGYVWAVGFRCLSGNCQKWLKGSSWRNLDIFS